MRLGPLSFACILSALIVGCGAPPTATKDAPVTKEEAATSKGTELKPAFTKPEQVAEKMQVPAYPGASFDDETVNKSYKNDQGEYRLALTMVTKDPVDKVAKFYEGVFALQSFKKENGVDIMGRTKSGTFLMLSVTAENEGTVIRAKGIVSDTEKKPATNPM
jgi:hypothetical protein